MLCSTLISSYRFTPCCLFLLPIYCTCCCASPACLCSCPALLPQLHIICDNQPVSYFFISCFCCQPLLFISCLPVLAGVIRDTLLIVHARQETVCPRIALRLFWGLYLPPPKEDYHLAALTTCNRPTADFHPPFQCPGV